jgi:O-antigen biosynthesis protein WbqP
MKRTIDLVVAIVGLIIAGPIIGLLVLLIRRESNGPGIFRQQRVGRHGVEFTCYKLRSMYLEAPNVPTHLSSQSLVTPLGGVFRRTKLDELPQLWNIVKGEMSFVGPRPCLPSQTELINERKARNVFSMRPGITGLAQIQNIDMSDPVRLAEKDAEYLKGRSTLGDLGIIFRTVFAGAGSGDRVRA